MLVNIPLALGVVLLLGAGCASARARGAADPVAARYLGVVPCASCPAIRLDVTLRGDGPAARQGRYELQRMYVATRDGDRTFTGAGRWTIERGSGGRTIFRLVADAGGERESFLKVEDDELRVLGADDTELPPSLPRTLLRVDPASGARPVMLGVAESGRRVRIMPGQEVEVRLESNPSTGYRWSLTVDRDDLLLAPRDGVYAPHPDGGRVGAGGVETWRIMGVRAGETTLRFEYRRPWERGVAPAQVVTFAVTVR